MKFPYLSFKPEELYDLESTHYFIFMGGDSVCVDGVYTFTQKETAKIYNDMLKDLIDMYHDSTVDKDKKYAMDLIGTLTIVPVRIH